MTPSMAASVGPQAAQILAGVLMAGAGQLWAWYRESHKNGLIVAAATAEAKDIVFKGDAQP